MKTEDLAVDKGGQGKVVEEGGEVPVGRCQRLSSGYILFNSLPNIGIAVFSQAFVIEAVHLGQVVHQSSRSINILGSRINSVGIACEEHLRDLTRLVVAPEDCDSLPKPHFQADQQRHLNKSHHSSETNMI